MTIEVIRSKRKTISVQIYSADKVKVRAPYKASMKDIQKVIDENKDWIESKLSEQKQREEAGSEIRTLTFAEIEELADRACEVFKDRVAYYAPIVGVTYGRITVRNQKTRWGSCSSKGNLNFNVALMRAPLDVLDYVVVHELCHRKEPNHSVRFYNEVKKAFPSYKEQEAWLKENGWKLMKEIHG